VKHGMVAKKLGTMPRDDMRAIEENLTEILGLS